LVHGGGALMRPAKPWLAFPVCLAVGLTACTVAPPSHHRAALILAHRPHAGPRTRAGCPLGRLLPHGGAIAIDYVDFLRFGGRMYIATPRSVKTAGLGRVIAHVRCSLAAEENQRRAEPALTDLTASFLAAGSAVYRLRGYPPGCRLA